VKLVTCYLKSYIQPFERKLAIAELRTLARSELRPVAGHIDSSVVFETDSELAPEDLASRLAYWEVVQAGFSHYTRQVRAEATANVVRNGVQFSELQRILPFRGDVPLPNRRCLRYGTHGIHEYRGKFFPQLALALINVSDLHVASTVLDPMCGSGTALVEAVACGHSAYGLDLNPLSVLMARTKCALLSTPPRKIIDSYNQVRDYLLQTPRSRSSQPIYFRALPKADQSYLSCWFSPQVIEDLDRISAYIHALRQTPVTQLMWLSLSNILRAVSWQKEDDLRVRKEIRLDADIDPIKEFLEELGRSVRLVVSLLIEKAFNQPGTHSIGEGDARTPLKHMATLQNAVDLVITSPPYATALPYLDTDRLSLIYLQLLTRPSHRARDHEMIGNREISNRLKNSYWDRFHESKRTYPSRLVKLVEKIHRLNQDSGAGFRRQNLPSLLAKYFDDMKQVLTSFRSVLRNGASAFVVVGNNHTIAGGERVEIETASLLQEVGESIGLIGGEAIPMEMLVSRDIFKKNASASEYILHFKNYK
jgi:site-specific DNA-methyltransferase (cytosine-N4-specific)